jgi:hypothetical protein
MSNDISVPPNRSISADTYSTSTFESRISFEGANYDINLNNIITSIYCNISLMSWVFVSVMRDENRYGNPIFVC